MDEYLKTNQETWDTWTRYHLGSKFYDIEGFKAGTTTLDPIVLAGPGDVTGKSLLHLQCHFGLDTLKWARRGAIVTGINFSEEGIKAARALAAKVGIPANFIQCNLYDLPQHLTGQFDVVFTSHGVLAWLPDLERWAQVIAHFLKPGGIFYIVEAHPVALLFDENREDREFRLLYPYFQGTEPLRIEENGCYAVPEAPASPMSGFIPYQRSSGRCSAPGCGSPPLRNTLSWHGLSSPGSNVGRSAIGNYPMEGRAFL